MRLYRCQYGRRIHRTKNERWMHCGAPDTPLTPFRSSFRILAGSVTITDPLVRPLCEQMPSPMLPWRRVVGTI